LFSYLNPSHEEAIAKAIGDRFPDARISMSSRVAPEWKEFERASTTATNAYLIPVVSAYLGDLRDRLKDSGLKSDFFVMQSNGGVMTSLAAESYPSRLVRSGPAAGARAGAVTAAESGFAAALSLDMGGTSTDIALIDDDQVQTRHATELEVGMPLLGGAVDVESIGSGGGSVARVDEYGRLHVGPESVGSLPGPACYGRGGERPTFVDAAVVLGWLDPAHPLAGGEITIDPALAERAVSLVAHDLGVSALEAAAGIVRVGLSKISEGAHAASIGRGRDARKMALVAFGGAGPLVGSLVARELAMDAVAVPPHPGAHSAAGLLLSDFRYDFAQTSIRRASSLTRPELGRLFGDLEAEARTLLDEEGIDREHLRQTRSVEARYAGQTHSVEVILENGNSLDPDAVTAAFHARHEQLYSYALADREVELVTWRVTAEQARAVATAPTIRRTSAPIRSTRRRVTLRLDGDAFAASVVDRSQLGTGDQIAGPAIVTQMDSATLLVPGDLARVDVYGNLVIRKAS
jgi:N-methylhydantoinase A